MFNNLDEVIAHWRELYRKSGEIRYKLTVPGYSRREIAGLEEKLGVEFHPTFRELLRKVKLDSVRFRNLHFGFAYDKGQLDYLRQVNAAPEKHSPLYDPLLVIGSTDGYDIRMDNNTGIIHVVSVDQPEVLDRAAEHIGKFICVAATIAVLDWPEANVVINQDLEREAKDPGLRAVDLFLDNNEIVHARNFWRSLALGWT